MKKTVMFLSVISLCVLMAACGKKRYAHGTLKGPLGRDY